ncbi:helix-turn-helix domain-containing protein [Pseudonocardia alni]|uniref:Lambda repressor-like predicted transcriptional regulator n=1 Tax=Pseudonocardia alni TaxID=33907 RepID=A0A852W6W5_PSEA5|nr:helix-turn-helix transcriptional regulator [Pseudonocardia antarctica]NYG02065.1 lambda repressor-like predicted transcriptional regulator [Pseudonocardia antarctica]
MTESPDGRPLDSPELFCRDFAAVLDARGVSVREAAERSNWSKSAIGNACTGPRLPRGDLVTTVLAAVGVPAPEVREWARRHAALAAAPASPTTAPARLSATGSADVAAPAMGAHAARDATETPGTGGAVPPAAAGGTEPTSVAAGGTEPMGTEDARRTARAVVVAVLATALVAGGAGWLAARTLGAPAAASAGTAVVTVQNKVALGAEDLVEDSGPAYLSSRAIAFCGSRGCKEVGTDVVSGAMLPATCTVVGERMWNHNLDSPAARNPHRVESELWYRVSWPDGRSGYLSEVYLEPASRGGLGLPACG